MELTKKYTIDYSDIENWMVTAIEGGADYWALIWDRSAIKDFRRGEPLSIRIADACWNHDVSFPIYDVEDLDQDTGELSDDAEPIGQVNRDNLERGCRLYVENGGDMSEDADFDANDADVWFQYVVMGEIVYG